MSLSYGFLEKHVTSYINSNENIWLHLITLFKTTQITTNQKQNKGINKSCLHIYTQYEGLPRSVLKAQWQVCSLLPRVPQGYGTAVDGWEAAHLQFGWRELYTDGEGEHPLLGPAAACALGCHFRPLLSQLLRLIQLPDKRKDTIKSTYNSTLITL